MSSILEMDAIFNIASRLDKFKTVRPGKDYNFRCPICGDSQKSEHKARAHFFLSTRDDIFIFNCFNCSATYSFQHYLKLYWPDEYKELRVNIFKERGIREFAPVVKREYKVEDIFDEEYQKLFKETLEVTRDAELIVPCGDLEVGHIAYDYLAERQLPTSAYDRLFYTENFEAFIRSIMSEEMLDGRKIPSDARIVFVLQTADGEIMGFQARALDPESDLRYSIIMMSSSYPKIFGLENIDKNSSDPIFVTEGAFDSFFIHNAIAVNGGDTSALKDIIDCDGIDKDRFVVILDNEPRSKDTVKRMYKTIKEGYKIVTWDKVRTEHKDINDMLLGGVFDSNGTFNRTNTLKNYILHNNYTGSTALVKLKFWAKVHPNFWRNL